MKKLMRKLFWWTMQNLAGWAYSAEEIVVGDYASIAVDLDGVIAVEEPRRSGESWNDWYSRKKVMPGAVDGMRRLKQAGWFVFIYTTRRDCNEKVIKRWLREHGVQYGMLVLNKPPASVIVDDHAVRFVDWDSVLFELGI